MKTRMKNLLFPFSTATTPPPSSESTVCHVIFNFISLLKLMVIRSIYYGSRAKSVGGAGDGVICKMDKEIRRRRNIY